MSTTMRGRSAVALLATASLLATLVPSADARAFIRRNSANGCTTAGFDYTYSRLSDKGGKDSYEILFQGTVQDAYQCRNDGYGGVFQWSYERYLGGSWSSSGGWRTFAYVEDDNATGSNPGATYRLYFHGDDYRNVHFRSCNWNPRTGTIGTCGSS